MRVEVGDRVAVVEDAAAVQRVVGDDQPALARAVAETAS